LLRRFVRDVAFVAAGRNPLAFGIGGQVKVEEGGVEFGAEQEAALPVPPKGRAVVGAVFGEWFEVPRGKHKFKNARTQKLGELCVPPRNRTFIPVRR
jgi:hypothetical protein